MSIMSMFQNVFNGGTAAPAPAAPAPAQPGNLPAEAPAPAQAGNVNAPAASPTTTPAPEGLDQFNDLWQAPQTPAGDAPNGMFNVDPKKLMEAAGRMDFSKAVTPDQLSAISQGGDGAVQAFAQAMNKVAQTVYAQNAMATTKIVEQALKQSKESFMGELPQHIKRQQVNDTLRSENPAFSHPAAAPILGALQQQLSVKFPNATATELSGMAKTYMEQFALAASPQKTSQSPDATKPGDTDWSSFL